MQQHAAWKLLFVWAAILLALLMLLYSPSFDGPYVFDDLGNVTQNPAIETFPPHLSWLHAESRPVVMLSFSLERWMFGESPMIHRLVNVVLLWVAACLLAALTFRLSHRTDLAVIAASLWAIHPLQTQSVAYITQRCESMMGVFFLGYLLSIVLHDQTHHRRWLLIGATCFMLGLWSKTVMVTGLAVGPLLDRTWLSESWRDVLQKRAILYVPPMLAGVLAVATLMPGILRGDANVGFGGDAPPLMSYLAAQAEVIPRYVALAMVPIGLNIDHGLMPPQPWQTNAAWMILVAGVILAGGVAFAKGHRSTGFFVLAPLLILSPTSSFVPTADLMVEHRMFLPLACLITGLVVALNAGHVRFGSRRLAALSTVVACVLATLTFQRGSDYESATRLWHDSLVKNPDNARAAQNLTSAAYAEDRSSELLGMFGNILQQVQTTDQPSGVVLGRIGEELIKNGQAEASVKPLSQAISQDPSVAEIRSSVLNPSRRQEIASHRINLAIALAQLGQPEASLQQLTVCFQIADDSPEARAIAGDLNWRLGNQSAAIKHFERALELRPTWPEVVRQLQQAKAAEA